MSQGNFLFKKYATSILLAFGPIPVAYALTNGLALTPPMGWNSWNCFGTNINETKIKQIAQAMATNGMKDAGYIYVNLDDGWQDGFETNGAPRPFPGRFPSGMKALSDYIHGLGLKFGIYAQYGSNGCMNYFGLNIGVALNEELAAQTFSSWNVDFLKYDEGCGKPYPTRQEAAARMRDALATCGRAVTYSIQTVNDCIWQPVSKMSYAPDVCNMFRTTLDIRAAFTNIMSCLDSNLAYASLGSPGCWPDPDMLEVGNGSLTFDENLAHFGMWCIVSAPLIAGNDLRYMSSNILSVLTAPELIAVNQDPAGAIGTRVSKDGDLEVWSKPLGSSVGARAVALLNRGTNAADITVYWTNIALVSGGATVRDLWARADLGTFTNSFTANVPRHVAVFVKILSANVPRIDGITLTETNIIINGTGTVPNGACYVLTSTNLNQPLNLWTRVATNLCDTSGKFAFTNTANPRPTQSFYLLQLP